MGIPIKLKSEKEMVDRLKDLLRRHKNRYIKSKTKPKGDNCIHKAWDENKQEWFCSGCGTRDPEVCLNHGKFSPAQDAEQLKVAFREDLCNTQRMLRDYRDIATLLWSLGQFDDPEEYERVGKSILEEAIPKPKK